MKGDVPVLGPYVTLYNNRTVRRVATALTCVVEEAVVTCTLESDIRAVRGGGAYLAGNKKVIRLTV